MSKKYIVTCTCSGVREKAMTAFSLLYPDEELPEMFIGKDRIRKLIEVNPGTNFCEYLKAIVKKNGQYAYMFEVENGDIINNINLLNGKKAA